MSFINHLILLSIATDARFSVNIPTLQNSCMFPQPMPSTFLFLEEASFEVPFYLGRDVQMEPFPISCSSDRGWSCVPG